MKAVEDRFKSYPPPARGVRGLRGQRGRDGEDGKSINFSDHEETFKAWANEFSLKFSDLSADEIEKLRGPKGRDGSDGRGFNFSEHEETIKNWSKEFALKFEDLTTENIESLRGPKGRDGADGKSLNFSDHEETFKSWARDFALKFEDLSAEEIGKLRGPRGRDGIDGRDGKDFDISEHSETIRNWAREFAFKFSDLSADEIEKLRGPRGRDGKDGKGFIFEEHEQFFKSLKPKFSDFTEEEKLSLKLKFSELTEEEKSNLKLKFSDLSDEEKTSLKGARGNRGQKGRTGDPGKDGISGKDGKSIRGLPGITGTRGLAGRNGTNGRDGADGKDAPYITDIQIDQYRADKFIFIFYFSDGTKIESDPISLPRPNVYNSVGAGGTAGSSSGSGGGGPSTVCGVEIAGNAKKALALSGTFSGGDTTYTLSETPNSSDEVTIWLNGIMRTDYSLTGTIVTFVGQDTTGQTLDAHFRYGGGVTIYATAINTGNLTGVYSSGDTKYILPQTPIYEEELIVWLDGVMRTDYTLSGLEVTFSGVDTTSQIFDSHFRYDNGMCAQPPVVQSAEVVLVNVPCDSSVYVGAAVKMLGGIAYNALADSLANSNVIGIAESKTTSTLCNVRVLGVSPAVYSGLDETKEYFLSDITEGLITTVVPTTSGHIILRVGQPFSSTRLLVLKGIRIERA
jgi:hypothetical protein